MIAESLMLSIAVIVPRKLPDCFPKRCFTSSRGDDAHLSLDGGQDLNYCAYVHVENILLA